jgi:hypothetical protein
MPDEVVKDGVSQRMARFAHDHCVAWVALEV